MRIIYNVIDTLSVTQGDQMSLFVLVFIRLYSDPLGLYTLDFLDSLRRVDSGWELIEIPLLNFFFRNIYS